MRDIFLIICPLTDKIKGISSGRYGLLPSIMKKDKEIQQWLRTLRLRNLSPKFELIDVIQVHEAHLIMDMYIGLFKSWNIELPSSLALKKPRNLLSEKIDPIIHPNKFLIDELPDLHKILQRIVSHFRYKNITSKDLRVIQELVLLCALNLHTSLTWEKILSMKRMDCHEILQSITRKLIDKRKSWNFVYLETCINSLGNSASTNQVIFQEVRNLPLCRILETLNYLLAYFQLQVFFNETIWINAYELTQYLTCFSGPSSNCEIHTLFDQLIKESHNHVSADEFIELTERAHTLLNER